MLDFFQALQGGDSVQELGDLVPSSGIVPQHLRRFIGYTRLGGVGLPGEGLESADKAISESTKYMRRYATREETRQEQRKPRV